MSLIRRKRGREKERRRSLTKYKMEEKEKGKWRHWAHQESGTEAVPGEKELSLLLSSLTVPVFAADEDDGGDLLDHDISRRKG